MKQERLISADLLKTVCIIGVVFIHGATTFGCGSEFVTVFQNLFRFAVPCFFIMWAFFLEKSYVKKTKEQQKLYLKRRFKHDFIVYVIWSIIYFFISVNWTELTFAKFFTTHFLGYGWAGQYFLIVLLQLTLIYPVLRYCYAIKFFRWTIVLLMGVLYVLFAYWKMPEFIQKLGHSPFVYWIVYVFTGIALARGEMMKLPKLLGLLVFLIPIEFYFLGESVSVYILPFVLIGSIALCVVMLQSSIHIKNKCNLSAINAVGGSTMAIFAANPLVIMFLRYIHTVRDSREL